MSTKRFQRKWWLFAGGAAVFALSAVCCAQDTGAHVGSLTGHADRGKRSYLRFCVGCHGAFGDGEGENAPYIDPKPRDFTLATFKCRSTPTGTLPTDKDLFDTIGRGIDNSNMPAWAPLTDQDRVDLVSYIKTFSARWKIEKPGTPLQIPASKPEVTAERLKAGQALFQKMECWKCHGAEGRGNGPSASTLTDSKDRPIVPYDFTSGHRFKCGSTDRDLYTIFMTGLDGTPMPSFSDSINSDQAWDLVFYLRTFQPMHTKERDMAKQIGLRPIDPTGTPTQAENSQPENK
jgi:mono/diheme cytochrome c family protein